jgi:hypothetical protein
MDACVNEEREGRSPLWLLYMDVEGLGGSFLFMLVYDDVGGSFGSSSSWPESLSNDSGKLRRMLACRLGINGGAAPAVREEEEVGFVVSSLPLLTGAVTSGLEVLSRRFAAFFW